MTDFDWIASQPAFDELLTELRDVDAYALDTEFHRERTFLPVLALVQVATRRRIALIDPLSLDVSGLRVVFEGDATCVMHAASQDLEILELACGTAPRRLFDTQIAALFCGYRTSSLAKLVEGFVGHQLDKSAQLSDWTRRPLPKADLAYAASDVEHLLDLRDALVRALEERSRLTWAEEEIERLRTKDRSPADPDALWWKLRGKSKLHGRARGVAQELARWRYRQAERANRPPRSVLSDMALLALAQRPPKNPGQLRGVRNFDDRHFKHADAILVRLREPGGSRYRVPEGGLYRWVSCPNYLGEIVEWLGWAVATWSLPGLAFAVFTMANLVPRAMANHRWYRQEFPDYPETRRALIPGVL